MAKEWIVPDADLGCDGAYFDYQELVRCWECKYFLPEWPDDASSVYQCHKGLGWPGPDGYCYKGERKDGAE